VFVTVPPILFCTVISLSAQQRPLLACRASPGLTVAAAMRTNVVVQAPCGSHRVARPTHLAPHQPAQSPGRRHRCRRRCALTAPFQPSPVRHAPSAGLLAVAVLRRAPLAPRTPPLAVSWGGLPSMPTGGESGSSSSRGLLPATVRHKHAVPPFSIAHMSAYVNPARGVGCGRCFSRRSTAVQCGGESPPRQPPGGFARTPAAALRDLRSLTETLLPHLAA
jgi:hypothetical protein